MRSDNRALLDRILLKSGIPPMSPINEVMGGPRVVPRPAGGHPWRRNASMEAKAWDEFNQIFPDNPTSDDILKERKG